MDGAMAHSVSRLTLSLICLIAVSTAKAQQFPTANLPPEIRAVMPQLNDPTALADPNAQLDLLRELGSLPPAPQGVVVMTDGRTFSGTIKEQPGGYRVEFSGTYMTVPFEYALVTATSLQDAYIKLRDNVPRHTAETHMKLAEWCRDQGLLNEALQEVGTAIKMEPLRSDARQLLSELQQHVPPTASQPEDESRPAAMTADGFTKPESRTTLGLSRESMQSYIRHVQPLILNKCGNRGCHSTTSTQSFQLTAVGGLIHQKTRSEENLAAILELISPSDPINSPLIRKPLESTPAHQTVFAGSAGRKQYALLCDWVQQVLREQPASPVAAPQVIQPVAAHSTPKLVSPPRVEQPATSPATSDKEISAEFLNETLKEQRPDAFDPESFNRRVHGKPASQSVGAHPESLPGQPAQLSPSAQRFSGLQPLPSLQSVPR